MVSLGTLTLLAALAAPPSGEPVLLDFTATWCGPCRTMEATVGRLERAGYPVRKVDIDREPQLATRFGVSQVPCFVLVANGLETDRVVGPTTFDRLERMFLAQKETRGGPTVVKTDHRERGPTPVERALAATVRLTIGDPNHFAYGTGTIIDQHGGEVLILTCGHIFRESKGRAPIRVDMFLEDGRPVSLEGRLLEYDLDRDLGFVTIRPGRPVTTVRVADASCQPRLKDRVFSIGCDRGVQPRVEESHISALDRYEGPRNIEVSGQPVPGRSGGGLFTADGRLIGVCNASDSEYNEGLYAALPEIQTMLARMGLTDIFEGQNSAIADSRPPARNAPPRPIVPVPVPGGILPPPPGTTPLGSTGRLTRDEQAMVQSLQRHGDDAEVLCIVRSRTGPPSQGELFVLQHPSPTFLGQLSREFVSQRLNTRQTTSHVTANPAGSSAAPTDTAWHARQR